MSFINVKHTPTPASQLSDTDLRLLRLFQAVARCGGLTAAESELNIGRSSISRHLKDPETRLGATLCHRGRSGFALTDVGIALACLRRAHASQPRPTPRRVR